MNLRSVMQYKPLHRRCEQEARTKTKFLLKIYFKIKIHFHINLFRLSKMTQNEKWKTFIFIWTHATFCENAKTVGCTITIATGKWLTNSVKWQKRKLCDSLCFVDRTKRENNEMFSLYFVLHRFVFVFLLVYLLDVVRASSIAAKLSNGESKKKPNRDYFISSRRHAENTHTYTLSP